MSHRIRVAALVSAVLVALPVSAMAGPSDRQPAQTRLTLGEARYYARVGAGYLAGALERPDKPKIGECKTLRGRLLWSCPATVEGADTRCTLAVWVWASKDATRYYEYHSLRCVDR